MKRNTFTTIATATFAGIILLTACTTARVKNSDGSEPTIMLFAAAGLAEPLSEIIDSFKMKYSIDVQTNFASSGTLARQIEQQVIPDMYISASKRWMNYIDSLGYILPNSATEIASDRLVLVAPQSSTLDSLWVDSTLAFTDLLGANRLSMGDPAHVPAGTYAKQALRYFGWYEQVKDQIVPAKDVRSVLMVVEMSEAPLGIVYYTVAKKSNKIKIIANIPEQSHKPIVFTAGLCTGSEEAEQFLAYLVSPTALDILMKYGFSNK